MQTIYTPWACLLSMEQLYYYSGGGRGCQGVGGNLSGSLRGIGGLVRVLGGLVQVLGGLVQGVGRRPGDAEHRRRRAEPAGAARRAAACGRSLRVLRIWGGNGGVLGEFVQVLGELVQGEGRRPGDAKHRRRRAEPAGAARRAAACGRSLRVLRILGGNGGVLGESVQVLGGLVRGEGRRPGDAEHRRRRAEPAEPPGGRRPAAVFCGFCKF